MPRKPARQSGNQSPILSKKQELDQLEARIQAQLNETRKFIEKVPELKAQAQQQLQERQKQEILNHLNRPPRLHGFEEEHDFELVGERPPVRPKPLRKERSKAPLMTVVLLLAFSAVAYYAWRVLWQG